MTYSENTPESFDDIIQASNLQRRSDVARVIGRGPYLDAPDFGDEELMAKQIGIEHEYAEDASQKAAEYRVFVERGWGEAGYTRRRVRQMRNRALAAMEMDEGDMRNDR
jgi:hypothetical protein